MMTQSRTIVDTTSQRGELVDDERDAQGPVRDSLSPQPPIATAKVPCWSVRYSSMQDAMSETDGADRDHPLDLRAAAHQQ